MCIIIIAKLFKYIPHICYDHKFASHDNLTNQL